MDSRIFDGGMSITSMASESESELGIRKFGKF